MRFTKPKASASITASSPIRTPRRVTLNARRPGVAPGGHLATNTASACGFLSRSSRWCQARQGGDPLARVHLASRTNPPTADGLGGLWGRLDSRASLL